MHARSVVRSEKRDDHGLKVLQLQPFKWQHPMKVSKRQNKSNEELLPVLSALRVRSG